MYQAEAMWINFNCHYPMALKIAAGKACALTGESWAPKLVPEPQNYLVVPGQPWLDGFCIGQDLIRQFVAMPLAEGYSAEEQLTGEARHGGLQILAYPMKADVYKARFERPKLQRLYAPPMAEAAYAPPEMGLVRAADADRLASHDLLTSDMRVGVLAGTTGEARLLQLTGLADAEGILIAGTRIDTPRGSVVSDGSAEYAITAAGASPALEGRTHLHPPGDDSPQVVYLGGLLGEAELIDALRTGQIDAVARGEIGNRDTVHALGSDFTVTALDSQVEYGDFTLPVENTDLIACLNERLGWLTDNRNVGYAVWRADPGIFLQRADLWNAARAE